MHLSFLSVQCDTHASLSHSSSSTSGSFTSPSLRRLFYSCGYWSRCPPHTLVSAHNNTSWWEILTSEHHIDVDSIPISNGLAGIRFSTDIKPWALALVILEYYLYRNTLPETSAALVLACIPASSLLWPCRHCCLTVHTSPRLTESSPEFPVLLCSLRPLSAHDFTTQNGDYRLSLTGSRLTEETHLGEILYIRWIFARASEGWFSLH